MKINNTEVSLYLVAHAVSFLAKDNLSEQMQAILKEHWTQDQINTSFSLASLLFKQGVTSFDAVISLQWNGANLEVTENSYKLLA